MSDPRPGAARLQHQLSTLSKEAGAQHRRNRNDLVRELRNDDPERWTHRALADQVGCSPELISAILTGRVE